MKSKHRIPSLQDITVEQRYFCALEQYVLVHDTVFLNWTAHYTGTGTYLWQVKRGWMS